MTLYSVDIIECPKCSKLCTAMSLVSCNTFGATFYTDGFIKGPMYDEVSRILRCPNNKCFEVFWNDETLVSRTVRDDYFYKSEELVNLGKARPVGMSNYPWLIKIKLWRTINEEKYIRIRAWWYWNDSRRKKAKSEESLPEPAVNNCERLLELLDTKVHNENIMRAEILREIGRFQECLKQLNRKLPKKYEKVVNIIRKLAEEKKCCVSEIS